MRLLYAKLIALTVALMGLCTVATAQSDPIRILEDVTYGYGKVGVSNEPLLRPLKLDAYLPAPTQEKATAHPAIILAFGGAYHRGGRGDYQFTEDGASDTSMAGYCQALAARGIACFSIDYRLTPEAPALPKGLKTSHLMPKELLGSPIVTGRVEIVRQRMGLKPLDDVSREHLWNATFAAVEDMATALNFIRSHARDYNINADRIAVGGFSAGAMTALNLAYGEGADVNAVVSLSGTNWGYNLSKTLSGDAPPLLIIAGQWDLPGIQNGSAAITKLFATQNVPVSEAWVPNFGHFYPMQAPSLSENFDKQSILDRIVEFLDANL